MKDSVSKLCPTNLLLQTFINSNSRMSYVQNIEQISADELFENFDGMNVLIWGVEPLFHNDSKLSKKLNFAKSENEVGVSKKVLKLFKPRRQAAVQSECNSSRGLASKKTLAITNPNNIFSLKTSFLQNSKLKPNDSYQSSNPKVYPNANNLGNSKATKTFYNYISNSNSTSSNNIHALHNQNKDNKRKQRQAIGYHKEV